VQFFRLVYSYSTNITERIPVVAVNKVYGPRMPRSEGEMKTEVRTEKEKVNVVKDVL